MLPADTVGCEVPRLFTPPAGPLTPATTRGFEGVTFAEDVLGLELMPWQRWLLLHALELAPDGSYRFRTLLVLCARQNGKTTLMQVLALWRMFVDRAGLVIGTAQNLSMAEETWDGALSMAEGVPDLAAEVEHVSRVNGDKHLRLTTGERYKVTAASRRGGRGLSSDLVLLDELREHQDWQAWSAVTKTTMARPAPMVAGFSNAGDGHSVVLASLRDRALAAASDPTSTLGIFEWSAPDGCAIDDPAAWAQANPALGHRMGVQAIRSALETDPEDVIRCEVLCQWVTVLGTAIPEPVWAALADAAPGPPDRRSAVFALDVAPDHSTATLVAGWRRPDDAVQLGVAEHLPGVDWVVEFAKRAQARSPRSRLLVQTGGTAAFLVPSLEQAGVTVESVPRQFYAEACAALDAAVTAGKVRHENHYPLNEAVAVARWAPSGEAGQRLLARKDPKVSPLVAAALALHGVGSTVRRPGRFVSF